MQHAIIANGGAKPHYIHAGNGTSMTSKNVATLLTDLNITRSHSRPGAVTRGMSSSEPVTMTWPTAPDASGARSAASELPPPSVANGIQSAHV
jgi:hypothetical protein